MRLLNLKADRRDPPRYYRKPRTPFDDSSRIFASFANRSHY
jgi:hypothetical protein